MPVHIAGLGLTSTLGSGCSKNLAAMYQAPPEPEFETLDHFLEPLPVSFLPVRDQQASAADRLAALITDTVTEALEKSGLTPEHLHETPVYIGSSSYAINVAEQSYQAELDATGFEGQEQCMALPLSGFGQVVETLRARFNMQGQEFLFNTACTSSSNALLMASKAIQNRHTRQALVIGIETRNLTSLSGFAAMQLLSPDRMRPFDQRRNGLVLGEGCAAFLLRHTENSSGVSIAGGSSMCDTSGISTANPDGSTIAETIIAASHAAGVDTAAIKSIKAHGTASPMNDVAEAAGLLQVFDTVPPVFCLKPYVGHTMGACGAIELALMVLALNAGRLPASGGYEQYDAALGVKPQQSDWPAEQGYHLLNYFGFGGNNCCLLLHFQS